MCEEAGLGIMESRNLRDPDCIRGLTVRCLTYQMNELDTLFMYILYILSICDNDLFHFGDQSTTFGNRIQRVKRPNSQWATLWVYNLKFTSNCEYTINSVVQAFHKRHCYTSDRTLAMFSCTQTS